MQLRDYQLQGLRDIFGGWSTNDILMFVLATGGGKTVTFVDVIKQFLAMNKRAMLIAHREELITQAWNTLYRNKVYAGVIKGDIKTNYDLRCQVCSIQTLGRRRNLPPTDLIVIDEGHHVTDKNTYNKVLQMYPDAKVLIVTATPYRLSGDGFTELVKGKETKLIVNKTLKQLQDDGYLVPFRYFVGSIPDLKNVGISAGDYNEEEAEKAMEMAPLVESYKEHCNGKQGIIFAINVHHSKEIVKKYIAAGFAAAHLDANTPSDQRKAILDSFKRKELLIISNVGIITEGFDFPDLEFVQLARPTKSLSLYMQMIGRGSRALAGCVDGDHAKTREQRLHNISTSMKPCAYVLDNAGAWLENGLPTQDFEWERYFKGTKGKKKEVLDEIEIPVFIAEDEDGKIVKTNKAIEIEGMRLIEVTKEIRQKVINIKSLKEFDKYYSLAKNLKAVKKKGYFAVEQYLSYCKRNSFEVNGTCWDYIEEQLVKKTNLSIENFEKTTLERHGQQGLLSTYFSKSVKSMRDKGLNIAQFKWLKNRYFENGGKSVPKQGRG